MTRTAGQTYSFLLRFILDQFLLLLQDFEFLPVTSLLTVHCKFGFVELVDGVVQFPHT